MKQRSITGKSRRKVYTGRRRIVGKVHFHRRFHSVILGNERDVFVWLPPSYSNQPAKRYPVLYMHDGQNLIDPLSSFIGIDWQVDETVTRLIKEGRLKEIIIVGIYNTKDRLEEYSDSVKGNNYIRFIIEELKPFVDSNYRTLNDSKNTAVMGSSMGGLISFLMAWKHPDVFSMAGCMSSSFYYENDKIFESVSSRNNYPKGLKLYIDHGEDGLTRGQKMFALLTERGFVIGTNIDYYYAPKAEHNEAAWAKRIDRPLLFFFGS